MKTVFSIFITATFILAASHLSGQNLRVKSNNGTAYVLKLEGVNLANIRIEEIPDTIGIPAHLRVLAVTKPSPESNIRISVAVPKKNWNKRFVGLGNGGEGGKLDTLLTKYIQLGYAAAHTDLGTAPGARLAVDKPGVWTDFGFRATHEMTVVAKAVIEAYKAQKPDYSYFIGCSTGGQQGLREAQDFPDDYDGILVGAPANNRTHLHTMFVYNDKVLNTNPSNGFTLENLTAAQQAIIAANVGKDGGYPGDDFLTDPSMAVFRPSMVEGLLNAEQIDLLQQVYKGPRNPRTGESIYTGFPIGTETWLKDYIGKVGIRRFFFPFNWVFGSNFKATDFDFDVDMAAVDNKLSLILNANNPDLSVFRKLGGKIIMYHGLADALVPYQDALSYYKRVIEATGSLDQTQGFFRFFLVPGCGHCSGGNGINDFGQGIAASDADSQTGIFAALVNWVENDVAPEQITGAGTRAGAQFRRPIYPYPLFPHYIEGKDWRLPSSYQPVEHRK
ncbi:MAG: tannase/feruloyl esterase family alpha/beta hydrolase [Dysgonamonadaceae bacterium]|jgi:feruloyl esterase|nr:tannase/feruloyl esterase family alpha/beta hydrolase [Dysgonamonadaceae bacterium]